jgi:ABC-type phosphate transport system substrate-binding protein
MQTQKTSLLKSLIGAAIIFLFSGSVVAEIAVIVSPGSRISTLSGSEIKAIYLGKSKKLKAVDQSKGSAIRVDFLSKVVGKSESQFKAYWSKKIFSGKGMPPRVLDSGAAIKRQVASSRNMIGYIDSSEVDDSVKVVYKVQ